MSKNLLSRLDEGPVIFAEGYLFAMERRGYLSAGPFVPEVVLEHPDVVKKYDEEVSHYNEQFAPYEQIKKFVLMKEAWSVDGGELTATMKLKRKPVLSKYNEKYKEIYS